MGVGLGWAKGPARPHLMFPRIHGLLPLAYGDVDSEHSRRSFSPPHATLSAHSHVELPVPRATKIGGSVHCPPFL